jgi:NAD(P)-dependent dehydrogenase (short-subunit alcohol dehydrogenase family)
MITNHQMNLFSLKNKVILITGGYGHLGKSISEGLAEQGAVVVVLARNESKFNDVFQGSKLKNIHFHTFNIAITESIKTGFQAIYDRFGQIDVLINNAYYMRSNTPEMLTDDDWNYSIDGSLNSVYRCIREVLPYLKQSKSGRIINVGSMYGMVSPDFIVYEGFSSFLNPPHYGAAKAGIIQLTKYFASYLAKYGILVNTVSPGAFPSKGVQEHSGFIDALNAKNPLKRIGQPDELKGVFVFLSSDASTYITGQNIAVDGGWTMI